MRLYGATEDGRTTKAFKEVALTNGNLTSGQQRILDTLSMLTNRALPRTKDALARWMGIHPSGGRFLTELARLREGGYLPEKGYELTERGHTSAGAMTTAERGLLDALEDVGTRKKMMLTILAATQQGVRLNRETLAERLNIHPSGGRYLTDLARLRDMGVIPEKGDIYAVEGVYR